MKLAKILAAVLTMILVMPFTMAHEKPDAELGYSYLVNGGYVGCGIPLNVMKRAVVSKNLIPPSLISLFVPMAGDDILNSKTRLPGRNKDNFSVTPSMNVFETKRGVKAVNYSCLSCHGEYVNGTFIVGLGNRTRDYTQDIRPMAALLPLLAWTSSEKEEVRAFQRSADTIGAFIKPQTVGVNPAINLTYALLAQRNTDDFTWSDTPTIDPPSSEFPPVDVPPWWRMGRKSSMFYNSEFRSNHHRIMSLASALCVEDKEEILAIEKSMLDVEAFVKSMKPPRYPGVIDKALAKQGEEIFNQTCSSCHGTYGEHGTYTEKVIPIDLIGTDPMLMEQQTGPEHERFRRQGEAAFRGIYNEELETNGQRGYIAPSLDGIWATAPFLHNGSVPSLEAVLDSSKRPKYWRKEATGRSEDFDVARVAVKFTALNYGHSQAFPLTKRYIYDTTLPGYGNQGHEFGDHLSSEERSSVIEFLKSL